MEGPINEPQGKNPWDNPEYIQQQFSHALAYARFDEELRKKVSPSDIEKLKDIIEKAGGIDELFKKCRKYYILSHTGESPNEAFETNTKDRRDFLIKIGVIAE